MEVDPPMNFSWAAEYAANFLPEGPKASSQEAAHMNMQNQAMWGSIICKNWHRVASERTCQEERLTKEPRRSCFEVPKLVRGKVKNPNAAA